jgi:hypothetical protein
MKTKGMLLAVVFSLLAALPLFAQGGRIQGKLIVGATPLSQGDIKIGEKLTTREGISIEPGIYRVSVNMTSLGECQFILTPFKIEQPLSDKGLQKNAMNTMRKTAPEVVISAIVAKNLLVEGIASNIDGDFSIQNYTPSEAVLSFNSKQFAANSTLGRSPDSKLVDLVPTFMSLEDPSDCGAGCIEGYVKITVRNDGNSPAIGKWNVVVLDPQFYVGTVADIPPAGEKTVQSASRIKLPCCNPAVLDAEVHADFYNKAAADSNDSNNAKRFTLKLKQ